ncbi:MAG: hypothetical protein KZQ95_12565 [Candidatus Thiodiazotropha sp. (ex Epidulcina cf. delphinae)]|nr:hypothetical protein [Candidatus Thiodiazotropha sp. (ex Epidulcina cf. delphinae)]
MADEGYDEFVIYHDKYGKKRGCLKDSMIVSMAASISIWLADVCRIAVYAW